MKYLILLSLSLSLLWSTELQVKPLKIGKKITYKAKSQRTPNTYKISMDLNTLKNVKNTKSKRPISVDIDSETTLVFYLKRYKVGKKKGDFSWIGKSKHPKAKAVFSVRNGVMIGTITYEKQSYKLYPENGHFKVIKIDKTKVIPFENDTVTSQKKVAVASAENEVESSEPQQEPSSTVQASVASGSDSIVTLLVYYTQALLDEYGASTESMIQHNIDLAHDSYIDSDTEINIQTAVLKLVPAGSLLSTANSESLSDLLNKLRTDGLVRYERELYQADAVTVFSKYPGSNGCGLGSIPWDATRDFVDAFSSVHIKPSGNGTFCSDLSFAHELGHNFGCQHEHGNSGTGMYDYAYGYHSTDNTTFGTIMSYAGAEIPFFSNPTMLHTDGTPIGKVYYANNARTIRENQFKMADNSEQISEALEIVDNDIQNNYVISGNLNNPSDRDGFVMWLDGSTVFDKSSGFYVNVYNEETHEHVSSFNADTTIVLPRAIYRVVMTLSNDETGYYYTSSSNSYSLNITTQFVDSDSDGDGLTDVEELSYNTDPYDADSDDDGLTDGAEVEITYTNPNDSDSDDDGISDGDEILNGTDPLVVNEVNTPNIVPIIMYLLN